MEGGIACQSHRNPGSGVGFAEQGADGVACAGRRRRWSQQRPEGFNVEVTFRQVGPDRLALAQIRQFGGGQQAEMTGRQVQGRMVRQHTQ
jgi:hypothetical protein